MTATRRPAPTPPGPLKVLVAVGAVRDREGELQSVIDSLESARRLGDAYVRVLEANSAEQISAALREHGYHVLHLLARANKGAIELEDEDGDPVKVSARELAEAIRESGHRPPLVFLVCCDAVGDQECTGFAQSLLESGVPAVLAMQTATAEWYATELTSKFYEELTRADQPIASRALAAARRQVEQRRKKASEAEQERSMIPEYAVPSLLVAGKEQPILDRSLPQVPIQERPPVVSGAVPSLKIGELIGRRREMRQVMQVLIDNPETVGAIGRKAGCQILGTGGIGKTELAGRIMQRMSDRGWRIATVSGGWDLGRVANAMASALAKHPNRESSELGRSLSDPRTPDEDRLQSLRRVLANHEVVLVLDHFEDTLDPATGQFQNIVTGEILAMLLRSAHRGKLLITSRHVIPDAGEYLYRVDMGPLSRGEVQRFVLRHSGLQQQLPEAIKLIERAIGGHPSTLEYLDALIRNGNVRMDTVQQRLQEYATRTGRSSAAAEALIEQLVRVVGRNRDDSDVLCQASVFPFPVPAAALRIEPIRPEVPLHAADLLERIERLAATSLLTRVEDDQVFIQRWTAELLKPYISADDYWTCCIRGAEYLKNRRAADDPEWVTDLAESIRLFVAAQEFGAAVGVAQKLLQFLHAHRQTTVATDLAREAATALPEAHPDKLRFALIEGDGLASLGFPDEARKRYSSALEMAERRVGQEPGDTDALRDLLAVYNRNGDLESALGEREKAREFYEKALQIAEQMAGQEPGRAECLRDLSVSYNKIGDLQRRLGEDDTARQFYEKALEVRERLLQQEPGRAEYLRDVCVSYERMADLESASGERKMARQFYEKALEFRERLAQQEPGRADSLRELAVSYNKMGDFEQQSGQNQLARQFYDKALDIAERLVEHEPERADYLRDLSVSYNKLGDLRRVLGKDDEARQFYDKALEIRERLLEQEPQCGDYRLDLAKSLARFEDAGRLQRAWEILMSLRESDQLAPDDFPVLQFVENRLRRTKTAGMGH